MNEKSGIECHTIMEVGKVIYQLRHRDTDMWISPSCGFHSSFFPILPAEEVSNLWNPANWADFILKSQWGIRSQATSSMDRGARGGDFFIMTFSVSLTSPVMLHFSHWSPSAGTYSFMHPSALSVSPKAGANLDASVPWPGTSTPCLFSTALLLSCPTFHPPKRLLTSLSSPWPTGILVSVMCPIRETSHTNFPLLGYRGTSVISRLLPFSVLLYCKGLHHRMLAFPNALLQSSLLM